MRRSFRILMTTALAAASLNMSFSGALAQQAVTPANDPAIGAPPTGPDDAQQTYDRVAIQQLMKIVELSRLIGGGISQMFAAAQSQKQVLDSIFDAQSGTRTIPGPNGNQMGQGNDGGVGLKEMADEALSGAMPGPQAMHQVLQQFGLQYRLGDAFALQIKKKLSQKVVAYIAAQGTVAAGTAELGYKRANASTLRLGTYMTALEASADLKTSVDLNTRVMIEVAQQINENLRNQAALTSLAGTYFMALGGEAGEDDKFFNFANFNR